MSFLKEKFKNWTLPWILQRTIIVISERRLPQLTKYHFKWSKQPDILADDPSTEIKPDTRDSLLLLLESAGWLDTGSFPVTLPVSFEADRELTRPINTYFDKIFVINLPGRSDRRLMMVQMLTRLGIKAEFFFADYGYNEENINEFREYLARPILARDAHPLEKERRRKMIFSAGAWGYLKTYRRLLAHAKECGYKRILCLDDDVIFHRDFHQRFEEVSQHLTNSWKLLYLGATQHQWDPVEKDRSNRRLKRHSKGLAPYYYPRYTDGTFAIGIDSSVFDILLDEMEKMNCSVDSGSMRHIASLFPKSCLILQPNLIVANVMESDITRARDQHAFAAKMRWDMEMYDFPFRHEPVSVIIPVDLADESTGKSILSILGQTYPNLEIIISDRSRDGIYSDFVSAITGNDPRIKYHRCQPGAGYFVAAGQGIAISTGKYLVFQDPCDISLPDRIEKQLIPLCAGHALFSLARLYRSECQPEDLEPGDPFKLISTALNCSEMENSIDSSPGRMTEISPGSLAVTRSIVDEQGLFIENSPGSWEGLIQQLLFDLTGTEIKGDEHALVSYLDVHKDIERVFERIDDVLLIRPASGK
jgi:hypothetical protein